MKQQQTLPQLYPALGRAQQQQAGAAMQTLRVPALCMRRVRQLAAVQAAAASPEGAEDWGAVASTTIGSGKRITLACVTRTWSSALSSQTMGRSLLQGEWLGCAAVALLEPCVGVPTFSAACSQTPAPRQRELPPAASYKQPHGWCTASTQDLCPAKTQCSSVMCSAYVLLHVAGMAGAILTSS